MKNVFICLLLLSSVYGFSYSENTAFKTSDYRSMASSERVAYAKGIATGLDASKILLEELVNSVSDDSSISVSQELLAVSRIFSKIILIEDDPIFTASLIQSILAEIDPSEVPSSSEAVKNIMLNWAHMESSGRQ